MSSIFLSNVTPVFWGQTTVDPMKSITKVANKASLNEKTVSQTLSLMKDLNEREISAGKNPMSLTATVLHLACIMSGDNMMQENLANAAEAALKPIEGTKMSTSIRLN